MTPDRLDQSLLESSIAAYGWMGTIADFLALAPADWLQTIAQNYQQLYQQRSTQTQQQAWVDSADVVRSQFFQLTQLRPDSASWTLIFEYELPREGGRRPDLILLGAGQIWVMEFKQKATPSPADLDQVAAYARDLAEYHGGSDDFPVMPLLVPTRCQRSSQIRKGIQILHPQELAAYFSQAEERSPVLDPTHWIAADYAPLPTVVQAARSIFQQEPLPNIKRANSAGIPAVLAYLNHWIDIAQSQHQRHLVLITGVPGAGKTLVGLQLVHQPEQVDRHAIFLSGNGPLITVLQYALKSRVFVQAVRNFYLHHEVRRQTAPREHLIVFDEAQRAWDADRMGEKYGIDTAASGAVVRIAGRAPDWCVLVGLIGEGQEIHLGEEDGTEQWNQGLAQTTETWHVHCSPEQADYFTAISPDRLHSQPILNLTTSLRTHLAENLQAWVTHLLAGKPDAAAALTPSLLSDGFGPYLTRDLEMAKVYCRDRYQTQPSKRYGLLASSRAKNLVAHGIHNDYRSTVRVNVGAWYIDPPDSPLSCCALEQTVTEFGCQGLELDFPIVGWGNDLLWQDQAWYSPMRQRNVRSPLRLRLNSYRVLLTRGRDGFVVFVPPELAMDAVFEVLCATGLPLL